VKRITPEQLPAILAQLPSNPRIIASGNFAAPLTLLAIASEQLPEFTLHMLNAQPGIPERDGITMETCFVGPAMRHSQYLRYIPSRLSLVPSLYRGHLRPDAVFVHASSPRFDTVSMGIEVNVLPAAVEAARESGAPVIVQANPRMPYTYGDGQLYDHEIDYLIEVDEPLAELSPGEPSPTSQEIGDRIAAQVSDGATLQLGIGGVPDAVLHQLTHRSGLRIWSEMFSDGALALEQQGALDPQIPLTASFLFGSRDLYDFVHLNHRVRVLRTETTNDPGRIARQRQMTSVNSALQVDLFDQANASRIHGRIYSGFGGSVDFIDGALHSRGGASYIALPSWHPKAGVSTIVPQLADPVTSFQHSYVVTEQGVAPVVGLSERDQARSLIENAAHPDARDGLRDAAASLGLF
jgi:acyl-CoA hydrolase